MHFGNLDFIVMIEGELMQAPIAVQPLHFIVLDVIAEALEELQLHAQEARTPQERLAPRLRLREARALAQLLFGTPTIQGGPTPPHLLVHQCHDTAC